MTYTLVRLWLVLFGWVTLSSLPLVASSAVESRDFRNAVKPGAPPRILSSEGSIKMTPWDRSASSRSRPRLRGRACD